jgi:hypothetical protein
MTFPSNEEHQRSEAIRRLVDLGAEGEEVTTPKILAVLSMISGILGTWLLYKGSVSLGQFGAYWNDKLIAELKAQNNKRLKIQRTGLGFLIASIVLAGASALLG